MKIELDIDLCEGHAQCEIIAPDYFEVRDDNKAYLLREDVDPKDEAMIRGLLPRCPVFAIRLEQ